MATAILNVAPLLPATEITEASEVLIKGCMVFHLGVLGVLCGYSRLLLEFLRWQPRLVVHFVNAFATAPARLSTSSLAKIAFR